jgi:hypothetical protein
MTKRKRTTAAEFLARLEQDPAYLQRRAAAEAALEARKREIALDERDLVREVQAQGYDVASVWDLVNNAPRPVLERRFTGPYPRAYPILVRHLAVAHHERVREGVIRALTVRDGGDLVETALLVELRREQSSSLRWVLANALRVAMSYARRRAHPEIAAMLSPGSKVPPA